MEGIMSKKRLLKLIVITIAICLVFAIGTLSVSAMTIDEARGAVYRVVTAGPGGTMISESCFAVGEDDPDRGVEYFITTSDILDYAGNNDIFLLRSTDDLIKVRVFQELPACRLVILQTREKLYGIHPLPLSDSENAILGSENYYSLGFPDDGIEDMVSAYSTDVTITQGIISKDTEVGGIKAYQTDVDISFGAFGGPIIDSNGNVIAISAFNTGTSGINAGIHIDYLTDVLDSRGKKYERALVGGQATQDVPVVDPNAAPVTPAPPTPAPVTPSPKPLPTPEPTLMERLQENNMLFIIIAAIALLLIIIVVVIALLAGKGKKQPAYQPPAQPMNMQPSAPTMAMATTEAKPQGAVLKCITGKLMGQSIAMSEGVPISMGRDPKLCQVVFGSDAGAISRKHCTIRYNGANSTFTLEDSSTNGTFLVAGKRLEKGRATTLKPGDKFYLDTKLNTFQVSID
jgi:hypothetical protein